MCEPPNRPPGTPRSNAFLNSLVSALVPVRVIFRWPIATLVWLLIAGGFTGLAILLTGPLRPGLSSDLATDRLALELLFGGLSIASFAIMGLERGVPGRFPLWRVLLPALLFLGLWLGITFMPLDAMTELGLDGPAHSMVGKRAHCFREGLALAFITGFGTLLALRQRALHPDWIAGLSLGFAVAGVGALAMQLACMYEPGHALRFHFSPFLFSGALMALAAQRLLTRG